MKKKSLVAMGLAGVMTIGMCVPVLAEDNTYDKENKENTTTVSATNPVKYTVTIPKSIQMNAASNELTVTLDTTDNNLALEKNKNVTVAVTGSEGGADKTILKNKLEGADASDTVEANISLSDGQLNKTKATTNCTISMPTFSYAGQYEGSIMFTIGYDGNSF